MQETTTQNIREQFISKFSVVLSNEYSIEEVKKIIPLLNEFISDYEISERNTDIMCVDNIIPSWIEEYFVAKCIGGCKDNSMKDYATHLNSFFKFVMLPIDQITESDVQKYIGYCLRKNNNSKSYVDHKRTIINDFFRWSIKKGYVKENPCECIPAMKSPRTSRVPYTDDELATIRNEVNNDRDKAIIETFISTACRVEELCRLNRSDIDFYEGTVRLFGKGDKHRTSYMNAEMKHALKTYLDSRTDNNEAVFVGRRRSRETGEYERVTVHGIEAVTRRMSEAIGVTSIQPHRFRRYTASSMANSGCNISDIQRFLGHTSPTVTAKYIYNDEENLKLIHKKYVR